MSGVRGQVVNCRMGPRKGQSLESFEVLESDQSYESLESMESFKSMESLKLLQLLQSSKSLFLQKSLKTLQHTQGVTQGVRECKCHLSLEVTRPCMASLVL